MAGKLLVEPHSSASVADRVGFYQWCTTTGGASVTRYDVRAQGDPPGVAPHHVSGVLDTVPVDHRGGVAR